MAGKGINPMEDDSTMISYDKCASALHEENSTPETTNKFNNIRSILAYWILGLCNNYGYVVMLTAASDIIENYEKPQSQSKVRQNCTYMSTGTILLADILPALIIKCVAPFIPFFVNIRVAACISLAAGGYIAVAFGETITISVIGVILTSFCSGLGEVTYLQYSANYKKSILSAWSSGTGGAGVIGAVSYTVLNALGMRNTLLLMLIIPVMTAISFWIILPKPTKEDMLAAAEAREKEDQGKLPNIKISLKRKFNLIPGLLKYMIPFGLVYLFEYFINQGTFEIIKFTDSSVPEASQYRWMQVAYQVGVFISRSSVMLCHIKQTWVMTVFQGINVIIFTTEAIYYYIPNFYIVLALVLWEGLLGGSSYINTYYRISNEVKPEDRQFSMAINGFADSAGIALAGLFAIVAHNAICNIPLPN